MADSCFWCRGVFNADDKQGTSPIMLLGCYQPCRTCIAKMTDTGIVVIEVASAVELKHPEMIAGTAPTGRWFVCDEKRFLVIAAFLQLGDSQMIPILTNRHMFVEKVIYDRIEQAESRALPRQ